MWGQHLAEKIDTLIITVARQADIFTPRDMFLVF